MLLLTVALRAQNPVLNGWYADPEAILYGDTAWIYPTYSAPYEQQVFLDAFSSVDLVHWIRHPHVLDTSAVKWATRAMWAPSVIYANDQYYLFFGANDIQRDNEKGGIGVAVSDQPAGPYHDALGKPLINRIVNGAQPIDQFIFRDDDGQNYLYYGGWGHCNVVRLTDDLLDLQPWPDGNTFKEITPEGYVEGPCMIKRNDQYYFMWSEGGWGGPNYRVAYAITDNPLGPMERIGTILSQDTAVASGAGHHSVINTGEDGDWFIVYHRRPLNTTDANHRQVCIDRLEFDEQGHILPVTITFTGIAPQKF